MSGRQGDRSILQYFDIRQWAYSPKEHGAVGLHEWDGARGAHVDSVDQHGDNRNDVEAGLALEEVPLPAS